MHEEEDSHSLEEEGGADSIVAAAAGCDRRVGFAEVVELLRAANRTVVAAAVAVGMHYKGLGRSYILGRLAEGMVVVALHDQPAVVAIVAAVVAKALAGHPHSNLADVGAGNNR